MLTFIAKLCNLTMISFFKDFFDEKRKSDDCMCHGSMIQVKHFPYSLFSISIPQSAIQNRHDRICRNDVL